MPATRVLAKSAVSGTSFGDIRRIVCLGPTMASDGLRMREFSRPQPISSATTVWALAYAAAPDELILPKFDSSTVTGNRPGTLEKSSRELSASTLQGRRPLVLPPVSPYRRR